MNYRKYGHAFDASDYLTAGMFKDLLNRMKKNKIDDESVTSDKKRWKLMEDTEHYTFRNNSHIEALDFTETILYQVYKKIAKQLSDKEFELFCECFERYVGRAFNMEMDRESISIMIPPYNNLQDKEEIYCVDGKPIFVMLRHRNFFPNDQRFTEFYITYGFSYIQIV